MSRPEAPGADLWGAAGALVVAALAVASAGGGMMGDRVGTGMPGGALEFMGVPVSLDAVPVAMLLSAGALACAWWAPRGRWRWSGPFVCFGVLLLWCVLSLAVSHDVYEGLLTLGFVGAAMAVGAAVRALAGRPGWGVGLAAAIGWIAALVAFAGLFEYVERWEGGNPGWRVFGPFVNPDFLAGYLLLAAPLLAALFLSGGALTSAAAADGPGGVQSYSRLARVFLVAGAGLLVLAAVLLVSSAANVGFARSGLPPLAAAALSKLIGLGTKAGAAWLAVVASRGRGTARTAGGAVAAIAGIGTVAVVLCLLLTQSRLGLMALAVEGACLLGLLLWTRALAGPARRRALWLAALAVVALAGGARPVIGRLIASAGEDHSARFRVYTWRGTARMMRAHPVVGTGLGTFETAYPRYAIVDYTQHAHDSYLQLGAEAGVPAALALVAGLGMVVALGVRSARRRAGGASADSQGGDRAASLLLCGLIAGIVGSAAHNVFDSDLYVPACAVMLGALCGLVLGLARPAAAGTEPDGTGPARRPRSGTARWVAASAAVVLAARGAQALIGRMDAAAAEGTLASAQSDPAVAMEQLRSAASIDPWNPEYHLRLSLVAASAGDGGEAEAQLKEAIRTAKTGKEYYRYGQFLGRAGRWPEAVRAHEQARALEPHNLQNLLALAAAYQAAGNSDRAVGVYRDIVALRATPFGRVRALPEMVDWEFGIAYVALAEDDLARGDDTAAEADLKEGAGILGAFWETRNEEMSRLRVRPDQRETTNQKYQWTLERLADLRAKRGDRAGAQEARDKLARFLAEKQGESNQQK